MVNLTSLLFVVLLSSTYYIESGSAIESVECEFCKKLFTYVYNLLEEDRAIVSIENALDSVCDQMFPDDQTAKICEDYVNKYTPMVVDLIVKTTDPDEACTLIQLCNGSAEAKSLLELISGKMPQTKVHMVEDDRCNECLTDVNSLRIDFRLARAEHIPKLQQCCDQFPTPDGLCDYYLNTINPLYDTLDSHIVPEEACSTFGVCPSKLTVNPVKQSTIGKVEPDCFLCRQVFKLVDQVIEKQAQIDIETAFDKVCNNLVLPMPSRKACRKYVDTYSTMLIDFITSHTDPIEACLIMGMCKQEAHFEGDAITSTSQQFNLISTPRVISSSGNDCDNCNKSVGWAAVTVKGYTTSLNSMLENTCLDYTHDNFDLCKAYMEDHFNSETNELIEKTSSDYFCINIFGLCPGEKKRPNYY